MTDPTPFFSAQTIGILTGGEVIGDGLIKIPFLRALRAAWPKARILWIATQGPTVYATSLRETIAPLIDEVLERPAWLDAEEGERPAFDLLIDTRGRWLAALHARWSLTPRHFIAPAFRYLFSDKKPPLFAPRPKHLVDRLLQTVELAAGFLPPATGRLPVRPDLLTKAKQILPPDRIYIGFAPGAGNIAKKWPLESFKKVAQLQARMNRVPVFLLGPQELDLYDELFRAVPEAIFPLQSHDVWGAREPTVEATLAIGYCLDLAVTNDSGTSHMLAAVDCPLISLFGPTSAAKLAPKVSQGYVLTAQGADMVSITTESVNECVNKAILFQGKV